VAWRDVAESSDVVALGLEGVLAFGVEIQQHVGLASLMTLMLGLGPCAVVLASFRNSHSVWKIGAFDVVCGLVSLAGLAFWASCTSHRGARRLRRRRPGRGAADGAQILAGAEYRVATGVHYGQFELWHHVIDPEDLHHAGALFPGCVAVMDLVLAILIVARVGPRVRGDSIVSSR